MNTLAAEAERKLALSYAPADRRAGLEALLALDGTLGGILRTTREPLVGQMRLTWWADALAALDDRPPPAQPVLEALARDVLPHGVTGAELAGMVDGWEALLDEPADLSTHAAARGGRLFAAAARVLAGEAPGVASVAAAGEGWALADLAGNLSDAGEAARARAAAAERLAAGPRRWPGRLRALGALALLARMPGEPGSPRRVGRLAWHRLTGR
jgi:15-cis-phytoene synthase